MHLRSQTNGTCSLATPSMTQGLPIRSTSTSSSSSLRIFNVPLHHLSFSVEAAYLRYLVHRTPQDIGPWARRVIQQDQPYFRVCICRALLKNQPWNTTADADGVVYTKPGAPQHTKHTISRNHPARTHTTKLNSACHPSLRTSHISFGCYCCSILWQ